MAIRHGYGKIATDGLVFAYDTGDRKNSYQGPPTQNYAHRNVANCSTTNGWRSTSIHTGYGLSRTLGVQKDGRTTFHVTYSPYERTGDCYHTFTLTDVNGNDVQTNGGEVFYLQFEWKSEGSQYLVDGNDNWDLSTFYGDGWKGGTKMSAQDFGSVPIGNGWYKRTVKYTAANVANQTPRMRFSSGYKRTQGGNYQLWVANIAMTRDYPAGNWFPGQSIRSSTEGLLDLTRNNNINIANVSFDSNSQLEFDGTNDHISGVLPIQGGGAPHTIEIIMSLDINQVSVGSRRDPFTIGNAATHQYSSLDINAYYMNWYFYSRDTTFTNSPSMLAGNYYHMVLSYAGGASNNVNKKVWFNGIKQTLSSGSSETSNLPNNPQFSLGRDIGRNTAYFPGKIPVFKVYNRALTEQEALNNFNHYKGRFDL